MRPSLLLVAALIVLGSGGISRGFAAVPGSKPNVLFIAIDDLRDWVGYLGRNPQVKTPNLDRLARMGLAFTRAYPPAPVCNPARAALMSGLRPSTTGVYENNNDWRTVVPEDKTLPTQFRRAGYRVVGSGKIYHRAFARPSEWDDYLTAGGGNPALPAGQSDGVGGIKFAPLDARDDQMSDYRYTNYGIAELGKKHDRPFFLAVGLDKPHMPWNVPRKYFEMFPLESIKLPPHLETDLADIPPAGVRMAHPETDHEPMLKSGRWKEAVQAYLAAIAYTDMNVGRLLDALEKSAYKDNTIICLWGDHGWHLGEKQHWRKFALWEDSTRTPLIWVVPGVTKPGTKSEQPVNLMSIYPTLMELCGIPLPAHLEARSVRPLLVEPGAPWSEPVLTTYRFQNHTVRVPGWRYIRYANGDEELYDEAKDPNEWTNLAGRKEFAARMAELKKYLPKVDTPDIGGQPGNDGEGAPPRK
jgi:arylsulfatase A-like enzyme